MSYTTISQLEHEARSTGDSTTWRAYFNSFRDSPEHVRNKCYSILAENPEGAKQPALEKLVEKGGVWIERDDRLDGYLHVHGLFDQTSTNQQPYTLSLAQKYFEHPEHDRLHPITNEQMFRQPTLARLLYSPALEQLGSAGRLQPPTTKQLDALSRALVTAQAHNKQPQLITHATTMLSTDLRSDINSSTRVYYDGNGAEIVHGFGDLGERILIAGDELDEGPICEVPPSVFFDVARAVLGTTEDAATVDARYRALLGTTAPTFLLSPYPHRQERAVQLWVAGVHRDQFFIDLYRSYIGTQPTRLVKSTPIAATENAR